MSLKCQYINTVSHLRYCVLNKGWTSKQGKIERGIRQGCPISALVFFKAVEINDRISLINAWLLFILYVINFKTLRADTFLKSWKCPNIHKCGYRGKKSLSTQRPLNINILILLSTINVTQV